MSAYHLPAGLVLQPGLLPLPQGEPIGPPPGAGPGPAAPPAGPADQGTTTQPPKQGAPAGPLDFCGEPMMLMLLGFVAILYFFMIRPQQKQEKARKAMLAGVKKNDRVVTTSGIHATVAALEERTVILKLDEKGDVRVKFDRSAIAAILRPDEKQPE